MKNIQLLFSTVIIFICIFIFSLSSFAKTNFPSYDNFEGENYNLDNFSSQSYYNSEGLTYEKVENGKLNINWGGRENATYQLYKNFDVPFVKGTMVLQYDVCFTEGIIYAYAAFPGIISSDKSGLSLLRTRQDGNIYIKNVNDEKMLIKDCKFQIGKEMRFKIEINLDRDIFNLYIDELDGSGYKKKSITDGTTDFAFSVADISKIYFRFDSYGTTKSKATLDNFSVYPADFNGVYVSSLKGNDNSNGSFYQPKSTVNAALLTNEKNIYLMSGEYDFDNTFTLGSLDRNESPSQIPLIPYHNQNITLKGNFNVSIPEIDNLGLNEENKNTFLNHIRSRYVDSYYSYPIIEDKVQVSTNNTKIDVRTNVGNNSALDEKLTFITAIYENANILYSTNITKINLLSSTTQNVNLTIDLPPDFENKKYSMKTFLWNGETVTPLTVQESHNFGIKTNSTEKLQTDILGNSIFIKGTATAGDEISFIVTAIDKSVVYLNQTTAKENGTYSIECKMPYLLLGQYDINLYRGNLGGGIK